MHAADATRAAVSGATQRALLVEWLSGIRFRAPTGEQFEGVQETDPRTGQTLDMVLFPTTARTPLGGQITVVGLYIDTDAETPEQGLVAEMTGMRFGVEPRRMELVPEATHMRIRYLDSSGALPAWVDSWVGRRGMPRGIEIVLEGADLPPLLRHPVRVALPARL